MCVPMISGSGVDPEDWERSSQRLIGWCLSAQVSDRLHNADLKLSLQSGIAACQVNFVGTLGTPFDWCLFDKARDEAHEKETRIAACGTNPGANFVVNFVVNLVVSFVALMNESETRSPDLPVAKRNGDTSNGPLSSAATWRRFGQPAARRRLDRFHLPAYVHLLFEIRNIRSIIRLAFSSQNTR